MRNLSTNKINKTNFLLSEMKKRKKSCLIKLQKLSDRINILEGFKNDTSGKNTNLKTYLESKGYDYKKFFSPLGYYTPNNMVVSLDKENENLTYHKGMSFKNNIGYHIPDREIVKDNDHQEITSSMYGMTWNTALNHYYPTTVFDTNTYSNAEGDGDVGMDIIGGLRIEDFANLTNIDEEAEELTSMVQGFLEEEYDNVEGELDLIEDAQLSLYGNNLSFEGSEEEQEEEVSNKKENKSAETEDTRKVKSGRNATCRNGCKVKHAFKRDKRKKCEEECDKKYKASGRQEAKRDERKERKKSRTEFRSDKKDCKQKLKNKEISKAEYKQCVKKEKKEKRSQIKETGGGNFGKRLWRTTARFNPLLATSRVGVLKLVQDNTWGFATRLAPALLPDAESKELFKENQIEKAKKGWKKVCNGYKNMGGDCNKLKSSVISGYRKKPYKVSKKSSFTGESIYEFEDYSNFEGYDFEDYSNFEPVTAVVIATSVSAGIGALTSLVKLFTKEAGKENPYKDEKTPADYKKALLDGDVETNPPQDVNAPKLNDNGEWIDAKTGKVIDPTTGKEKDTIFGLNKWLAIGIGVAGLLGLYYVLKIKK